MYTAILIGTLSVSVAPSPQPEGPLPSDCLYAVTLLQAPVGTPEPVPSEDRWVQIRDAVHHLAVKWQIMDKRESRYVFASRDDFETDLNLLRKRYIELKDVPPLEEITSLFPDRATTNKLICFNREYKKHLESRLGWESDREDLIYAAISEADFCYRAWDKIRDLQCDFYYVTVRRTAYKNYCSMMKCAKWEGGEVYPYVPFWRFSNIN